MVNYIEAARKCMKMNGCNGCPLKGIDKPCAEAFAEYITKCVEGIPQIDEYVETAVHEDVTIITADGVRGFMWYDEKGQQHQEDGFVFPDVRIVKGTVQELLSQDGERSAAWSR
jgi:hypothetical protein